MSRHHDLKCVSDYFEAVLSGEKTFEYRLNDRGFQAGDTVTLRETTSASGFYTDRTLTFTIGYVFPVPQSPGAGYVVFSLLPRAASYEGREG